MAHATTRFTGDSKSNYRCTGGDSEIQNNSDISEAPKFRRYKARTFRKLADGGLLSRSRQQRIENAQWHQGAQEKHGAAIPRNRKRPASERSNDSDPSADERVEVSAIGIWAVFGSCNTHCQ
jgi:hypothetical protein